MKSCAQQTSGARNETTWGCLGVSLSFRDLASCLELEVRLVLPRAGSTRYLNGNRGGVRIRRRHMCSEVSPSLFLQASDLLIETRLDLFLIWTKDSAREGWQARLFTVNLMRPHCYPFSPCNSQSQASPDSFSFSMSQNWACLRIFLLLRPGS